VFAVAGDAVVTMNVKNASAVFVGKCRLAEMIYVEARLRPFFNNSQ